MFISNLLQNPFTSLVVIAAFLVGLTVHEYAHAFVAYRSGDPTARVEGRLSLNPFAHLDPVGTLFFFIVGIGWAKPVPVNPRNFRRRSDELKVAFAGITANILLAFILALPIRLALLRGQPVEYSAFYSYLDLFVSVNLILATFNLLPIFPLDGSRLVEYFLDEPSKQLFRFYGPFLLFLLLILGGLTGTSIIFSIMEPILRFLSLVVKGTFSSTF